MAFESGLSQVGVVGAGRMGRGIAKACVLAEVPCVLVDLKPRAAADLARVRREAEQEVEGDLRFLCELGLLEAGEVPRRVRMMRVMSAPEALDAIGACEIVFEGVPETEAAKREAFEWTGRAAAATTLIASTTSTMNVDQLAQWVSHPGRFLNAHWLNPAHLMPIVEIARGKATEAIAIEGMKSALRRLGKVPVVCTASPGYIVPRIQALAMNEAARLVEEGVASVEDIDIAVRQGFGLRFAVLGLLEFIDWGGNDILYYASEHLSRTVDAGRYRAPQIVADNMREGRNGLREGRGFYDYRQRDTDAYRRQRLGEFVRLIEYLNLLPGGLKRRPAAAPGPGARS